MFNLNLFNKVTNNKEFIKIIEHLKDAEIRSVTALKNTVNINCVIKNEPSLSVSFVFSLEPYGKMIIFPRFELSYDIDFNGEYYDVDDFLYGGFGQLEDIYKGKQLEELKAHFRAKHKKYFTLYCLVQETVEHLIYHI